MRAKSIVPKRNTSTQNFLNLESLHTDHSNLRVCQNINRLRYLDSKEDY